MGSPVVHESLETLRIVPGHIATSDLILKNIVHKIELSQAQLPKRTLNRSQLLAGKVAWRLK